MQTQRISHWQIGATKTLLARCHSRDGAGADTGLPREGKFITSAQVQSIVCHIYDRSSATPDTSLGSPAITSSAIIAAVTGGYTIRNEDLGPYNFLFDLTTNLISVPYHTYRVTIDIALTTGTVLETFAYEAQALDRSP